MDAELLAILFKRFEDTPSLPYDYYAKNPYHAYTRDYFRRRSWRILRRLGDINNKQFVTIAKAVLLKYEDKQSKPQSVRKYVWDSTVRSYQRVTYHFPAFASHTAFNHILFQSSQQYQKNKSGKQWLRTSTQADSHRTEAYPHLWDEQPEALLNCLTGSECKAVNNFALKALQANKAFCDQISLDDLALIFCKPYSQSSAFAQDLIGRLHSTSLQQPDFLQQLFSAQTESARSFVHEHLKQISSQELLKDISWHLALITSVFSDNQEQARQYHSLYKGHDKKRHILLGKLLAHVQSLSANNFPDQKSWQHIQWTLLNPLADTLQDLSFEILSDLILHPVEQVQLLGAEILGTRKDKPHEIPNSVYQALMQSENAQIRANGVRLLGNLDKRELAKMPELLADLLVFKRCPHS